METETEALEAALAELLVGRRLEDARWDPESGLLVLWWGEGTPGGLAVGLGPGVTGLGVVRKKAARRAGSAHPLLAALRAHALEHRVRSARLEEGELWLGLGQPPALARVRLAPGRGGEAEVLGPAGERVRWATPAQKDKPRVFAWPAPGQLEALGAAMLERAEKLAQERRRAGLLGGLRAKLKTVLRREEAVRGDLGRLEGVAELQKKGTLLQAQPERVRKGEREARVLDWDTGEEVAVLLDPTLPPKAQAERYFARARRLQRGAAVMQKRLAETVALREKLEVLRQRAEALGAGAQAELAECEQQAKALGVTPGPGAELPSGTPGVRKAQARRPFSTYRDERGRPILVGRGGADNDALTARFARPHDLWLHAKEHPGAHVVVPLEKGHSCAPELLVDAATLAAHFSDARGAAVVDVSYVPRRYVRKPRGSAPGAAVYEREKVLAVRLEAERLERLLASREEG